MSTQLNLKFPRPAGVTTNEKGYLRYMSPVALRNKYVHRVLVEQLIAETPYSVQLLLPQPYEVHHIDHHKQHNCCTNFLITPPEFHSASEQDGKPRKLNGQYDYRNDYNKSDYNEPDWVNDNSL